MRRARQNCEVDRPRVSARQRCAPEAPCAVAHHAQRVVVPAVALLIRQARRVNPGREAYGGRVVLAVAIGTRRGAKPAAGPTSIIHGPCDRFALSHAGHRDCALRLRQLTGRRRRRCIGTVKLQR
eukprot:500792-Prymnesium_polylepis.1